MSEVQTEGRRVSKNRKSPGFFIKRKIATENFFRKLGFDVKVVGDLKHPNFILNNEYKIPAKFHKGKLILGDNFDYDGLTRSIDVFKFDLHRDVDDHLTRILGTSEKKKVFTIKYHNVMLHDLKYVQPNSNNSQKYPIFAPINPKFIYTKEYAEEIVDELSKQGITGLIID